MEVDEFVGAPGGIPGEWRNSEMLDDSNGCHGVVVLMATEAVGRCYLLTERRRSGIKCDYELELIMT